MVTYPLVRQVDTWGLYFYNQQSSDHAIWAGYMSTKAWHRLLVVFIWSQSRALEETIQHPHWALLNPWAPHGQAIICMNTQGLNRALGGWCTASAWAARTWVDAWTSSPCQVGQFPRPLCNQPINLVHCWWRGNVSIAPECTYTGKKGISWVLATILSLQPDVGQIWPIINLRWVWSRIVHWFGKSYASHSFIETMQNSCNTTKSSNNLRYNSSQVWNCWYATTNADWT